MLIQWIFFCFMKKHVPKQESSYFVLCYCVLCFKLCLIYYTILYLFILSLGFGTLNEMINWNTLFTYRDIREVVSKKYMKKLSGAQQEKSAAQVSYFFYFTINFFLYTKEPNNKKGFFSGQNRGVEMFNFKCEQIGILKFP